jgi:hypothetical protein
MFHFFIRVFNVGISCVEDSDSSNPNQIEQRQLPSCNVFKLSSTHTSAQMKLTLHIFQPPNPPPASSPTPYFLLILTASPENLDLRQYFIYFSPIPRHFHKVNRGSQSPPPSSQHAIRKLAVVPQPKNNNNRTYLTVFVCESGMSLSAYSGDLAWGFASYSY